MFDKLPTMGLLEIVDPKRLCDEQGVRCQTLKQRRGES